jgi:hypothetical protein
MSKQGSDSDEARRRSSWCRHGSHLWPSSRSTVSGLSVEVRRREERPRLGVLRRLGVARLRELGAVRTERDLEPGARVRARVLGIDLGSDHEAGSSVDVALQRDVADRDRGAQVLSDRQLALEDDQRLVVITRHQLERVGLRSGPSRLASSSWPSSVCARWIRSARIARGAKPRSQLRTDRRRRAERERCREAGAVHCPPRSCGVRTPNGSCAEPPKARPSGFTMPGHATWADAAVGRALPCGFRAGRLHRRRERSLRQQAAGCG